MFVPRRLLHNTLVIFKHYLDAFSKKHPQRALLRAQRLFLQFLELALYVDFSFECFINQTINTTQTDFTNLVQVMSQNSCSYNLFTVLTKVRITSKGSLDNAEQAPHLTFDFGPSKTTET